jgi:hypothetical protein
MRLTDLSIADFLNFERKFRAHMGKSVKTVATICPTVSLSCQGLSPLSAAAFHHNITPI